MPYQLIKRTQGIIILFYHSIIFQILTQLKRMKSFARTTITFALSGIISIKVNAQNIELFSDASYKAIPQVSTKYYKSAQLRDTKFQNPDLALGVAISGGGSRAQYFSTGVLLELEKIKSNTQDRNFLREIDYFSTVSGGCYAAGYYLTIQKNQLHNKQYFSDFYFSKGDKLKDFVGQKTSSGILVLAFGNKGKERGARYSVAERLNYEVLQYDSANANSSEKYHTQMMTGDFFIDISSSSTPELPMFVPNGTIFKNGERLPFMPHIISGLKIVKSLPPNTSILPLNSNGISDGYRFPLTYAITASSAFPGALPKAKFEIKDSDKTLVVIDGGVVDNLGYTTLLELLNSDTSEKINKKALIIDCSGDGEDSQLGESGIIGVGDLIKTSLLYTVQTKYLYRQQNINNYLCSYGIPSENSLIIGFSTILEKLRDIKKDDDYLATQKKLRNTKDEDENWYPFYLDFRNRLIKQFSKDPQSFKKDGDNILLSSLSTDKFNQLTATEILLMFEYSAQVETKLQIYADEREMLLLAGRYAVFLKQQEIAKLLQTH